MQNAIKRFLVVLLVVILLLPVSAFCSEISDQMKASLEEMPIELASPFAKVGLESIVFNFYRARVEYAPNMYEKGDDFKATFDKSFHVFRIILHSVELDSLKDRIAGEDIQAMEKSYSIGQEQFLDFANFLREKNMYFQHLSPDTILKSQMYFSLLLSGFNKEIWQLSRKFTHIWPFCD